MIAPHIHALALHPFLIGASSKLRTALFKIAGADDPGTVHSTVITNLGHHHMEYSPGEKSFRAAANYATKNDYSESYRSKALMVHVPEFFERYKARFR